MSIDDEIQEISDRIARLVRDAYKRGEADAIERLLRAAQSDANRAEQVTVTALPAHEKARESRKRARKGAVRVLTARALANGVGRTPDEIKAQAADDSERMIAVPSIRAHLRTGEGKGLYRNKDGRWYTMDTKAGTIETQEAADSTGSHAASDL